MNLVSSQEELSAALQTASKAGISGDVLVEECMTGPEVSVEIIVSRGVPHVLQVTDKLTSGAPNFYEIGHVQPTSLSCKQRRAISDVASSAVLAVGLKNSAAHAEVMLTSEGPKMVELGARLGGDWITSHLIWNSVSGIDMVETMIKLAEEEFSELSYSDSGKFVATKFLPAREGVLQELNGIETARDSEGVIHVEVHGVVGKRYGKAVDDSARFASVVASGNTKEDALTNCDRALRLIEVQMG